MVRLFGTLVASAVGALLLGSAVPGTPDPLATPPEAIPSAAPEQPAAPVPAPVVKPPKPKPPTVEQALAGGVLIVVSIPTQHVFVFKDGSEWGSATVSTGKRGHDTPVGVFPILQKSVAHRSTLYNDAPMPYMQRLTWGGVALHGGNVSRYRASHGCIRLPHAFAKKLFAITSFRSTAVLITHSRVASPGTALALVGSRPTAPKSERVELAAREPVPLIAATPPATVPAAFSAGGRVQTIQLAAAPSPQNADALWSELVERRPELGQLEHQVIPAVVNARQVYRLRASGAGAGALCNRLAVSGVACFKVVS